MCLLNIGMCFLVQWLDTGQVDRSTEVREVFDLRTDCQKLDKIGHMDSWKLRNLVPKWYDDPPLLLASNYDRYSKYPPTSSSTRVTM